MKTSFTTVTSLYLFISLTGIAGEKVPPMVPPAHYETAQADNYAHPGMNVGPGQPHMHQAGHYGPPSPQAPHAAHQPQVSSQGAANRQPVLNAGNIQYEKEHIADHLEIPMDTSKMSEQELQFYYFKMHDSDNNNKLDGIELIHSLIHWHEQGHDNPQAQHGQQAPPPKLFTDEELYQLIDPILKMDDANQDGYIDYAEFIRAQQKAAAN